MSGFCDGQLIRYSSVVATKVEWLWYPYIPLGKITLLQGDPGSGKSTLIMSIISAISSGNATPGGNHQNEPMNCIYQCSEDSVADTIKPRLIAAGADCEKVAFLDEDLENVSLDDHQLKRAIEEFNAKLLVIDPIQAYLGDNDLSNVTGMRRILRQLGSWAAEYNCAIVLVGHLNKKRSSNDLYRSLGSIDLIAAARSVLQIEKVGSNGEIAVMRQVKSSLTARGSDLFFTIDNSRLVWVRESEIEIAADEDNHSRRDENASFHETTIKRNLAVELMKSLLKRGPQKAAEVEALILQKDISKRTLKMAKKMAGVQSVKKNGIWYWKLPEQKPQREGESNEHEV